MREIKFKAFNKKENKMSKPFSMPFMLLNFTDDKGLGLMKDLTDDVVVQFTGLQDKNGVDVYEGDLISYDYMGFLEDEDCDDSEIYSVVFGQLGHSNTMGFHCVSSDGILYDFYGGIPAIDNIKVIGNIHENKELLK